MAYITFSITTIFENNKSKTLDLVVFDQIKICNN